MEQARLTSPPRPAPTTLDRLWRLVPDPVSIAALPGLRLAAAVGGRLPDPLGHARSAVGATLGDLFGADRLPGEQYVSPPGDAGWFGPDSVTWRVHADPAMIVGGLAALMLQTLHPLAMAGVAEHSDFRQRPLERLGRTSSFVTATTYGSTPVAERMAQTVRSIHRKVVGVAPDGRPYSAGDPDLLRWVHTAEFHAFARAHRRYAWRPTSRSDIDRYYDEVAVIADALGAREVPRDRDSVRRYFEAVRPELVRGEQAAEAMRFIMTPPAGPPVFQAAYLLVAQAAVGVLPSWAQGMLQVPVVPGLDRAVVRPATWTVVGALRALGGTPPPLVEARARIAG